MLCSRLQEHSSLARRTRRRAPPRSSRRRLRRAGLAMASPAGPLAPAAAFVRDGQPLDLRACSAPRLAR